MSPHIAIVDYKMGNLRSVQKSFEHAGVEDVVVTDDPKAIAAAERIVLPGQGAFNDCMSGLEARPGLVEALENAVRGRHAWRWKPMRG